MATNKALRYELLPQAARNELFDFYEFLVQKYVHPTKKSQSRPNKKKLFFLKVASQTFPLPDGYTFDRDSLHERQQHLR